MNLKPETPLIKKLEIKRLEDECENLRLWRWRLTIAIELILITVLGACEGFDICDYIPEGRANAVTRYELCMKTGFRDRQVRDLIHYARRDGSILNLSDGKGYFRPDLDDPVERGMLAAYVRQEESRRDSIDWSLNGAIKDCKENGIDWRT